MEQRTITVEEAAHALGINRNSATQPRATARCQR